MSKRLKCSCPKECDCQNPPPAGWDGKGGVYHVSESCPTDNSHPEPDPDCPEHGHMTWSEFNLAR